MLPLTIRSEGFEPIAGWNAKIPERPCLIQKTQFSQGHVLDVRGQFPGPDQINSASESAKP
jgi:hypothetical protein